MGSSFGYSDLIVRLQTFFAKNLIFTILLDDIIFALFFCKLNMSTIPLKSNPSLKSQLLQKGFFLSLEVIFKNNFLYTINKVIPQRKPIRS